MRETDKFPVFCPECREDANKEIGWLKRQTIMLCPKCGADITTQLGEALVSIRQAEQIAADDISRIRRGDV